MKKAGNSEKRAGIRSEIFRRMKNQDGASLMAALLFFVFCGVGASIVLAAASASAGKLRQLSGEDQKRYAVDSAAAFLRDELQKTENTVKIKEVIVEDSREDEAEDNFYCYYVGRQKKMEDEASWQKFYGTDSGSSSPDGAILDSLIVDLYKKNEYRKQTDAGESDKNNSDGALNDGSNGTSDGTGENSGEQAEYKDFTLSVKKSGTTGNTIDPLKADVRLWMADNYKITAVISDTVTADDKKEERCEKRLDLEAVTSQNRTVTVETSDDEDSDDGGETGRAAAGTGSGDSDDSEDEDDSYTITTTTIVTTIRWQNGTIEKELLEQDETK